MAENNEVHDVELPNGRIISGIPISHSAEQVQELAIRNNLATADDFFTPEVEPKEENSYLSNVARGAGERFLDLSGSLTEFGDDVSKELGVQALKAFGASRGVPSDTDELRKRFKQDESSLGKVAKQLQNVDLGYEAKYTWEKLKEDPTAINTLAYAGEQMGKSVPDMLGIMTAPAIYALARIEEVGDQRAVNSALSKLPENATAKQIETALQAEASGMEKLKGSPAVAATMALEKIGLGRLIKPKAVGSKTGLGKEIAKETGVQAGIEGLQEGGIEYLGETLGTGKELDLGEALDRGAAGAVAGGPFGGAVRAGTGSFELLKNNNVNSEETRLAAADEKQKLHDEAEQELEAQVFESKKPIAKADGDIEADGELEPQLTPKAQFDPKKNQPTKLNAYGDTYSNADIETEAKIARAANIDPDVFESNEGFIEGPMEGYVPNLRGRVSEKAQPIRLADGRVTRKHNIKKPVTYDMVRRKFKKLVGNRIVHGKLKGSSAAGTYTPKTGATRIKDKNDPEVLSHEVAHFLDMHPSMQVPFKKFYQGNPEVQQFSYTNHPKKVNEEGFAEFARLWFTQYPTVAKAAPNATKQFESLLKADPKIWEQMLDLQELSTSYYAQGGTIQGRAKYGDRRSVSDRVEDFLEKNTSSMARQKIQDKVHAAKVVGRKLMGDDSYDLPTTDNPYDLYKIAKGGAESIYEDILKEGTIYIDENGDFQKSGKGLDETLAPVKQNREVWEDFVQYMIAKRSDELTSQGREHLMERSNITGGLKLADKWSKEGIDFDSVFADYQAFNDRMLDFYVQTGFLKASQKEAFQEMNKDYVPFHRLRDNMLAAKNGRKAIHGKLTGDTANIANIEENITDGLMANIEAALESRAKRALFKMINNSKDGALFATKVPMESESATVNAGAFADRMAQTLEGLGIGISQDGNLVTNEEADTLVDVKDMQAYLEENPDLLNMFSTMVAPRTDEALIESVNTVEQNSDGTETENTEYYEVHEPLLIDMFENLQSKPYGILWDSNFALKSLMTRTVTSMLEFMTGNAARDTMHAYHVSKHGFKPVIDTAIGMFEYARKGDLYKEARRNGLLFSSNLHANTKEGRSRVQLDLPSREGYQNILDNGAKMLRAYDNFVGAAEYGTRLGEYRLAKKAGKSDAEATKEAREISGDFTAAGNSDIARTWIRSVPFMNASIVGLTRTAKAFRDEAKLYRDTKGDIDQDPAAVKELVSNFDFAKASFAAKAVPVVVFSLALDALNRKHGEENDDDRYMSETNDQRDRYWSLYYDKDKPPLRFKKPFELGMMFGRIPVIAMDYIRERDGKDMADAVAEAVSTQFGFVADTPSTTQVGLELLQNKKFTGAPIVPASLEPLIGDDTAFQATERTPLMYKKIGEKYGVSPLKLEHLTKGTLRYVEAWMTDASEAMLWDENSFGERPFKTSFIGRIKNQFVGRDAEFRTKYTDKFWELKNKAESHSLAMKRIEEKEAQLGGDISQEALEKKYPQYGKDRQIVASVAPILDDAAISIATINDMLNAIRFNSETTDGKPKSASNEFKYTAESKENEMNKYYRDRNKIFKQYFTQIEDELKKSKRKK